MVRIMARADHPFSAPMEDAKRQLRRAVRAGVAAATDGMKQEVRRQVRAAGLSDRVANAVRSKVYPSGPSARAAGYVYIAAKKGTQDGGVLGLIKALNEGLTIRSPNGFFLAIPTDAVPRKRMRPKDVEAFYGRRLRFVPGVSALGRSGRVGLLVMDNLTAGKRRLNNAGARRLKSGRGLTSAVMFILVPAVHMPRKLALDSAHQAWGAQLPALIANAMGG
ncbi:DUF6441 family protein [Nitrospirillum sp. BR 11163]|uniref:DUF6441 family protein n=1 Tax=Nitrospirillum sp. BR 11163 TaxID=3104323 RepID=UPI002AFF9A56|nr:DUF6441 family protein [Nitrospirillum sp. BR 11163]MEA1674106.1 DUF6441 family protein [Nitrospirillum sp. BR 11163]